MPSIEELADQRRNLPPALAEALTAMLAAPQDVALLSLRELGRRLEVSHSALGRLPRALGLPDYAALQGLFRAGMRYETGSLAARAVAQHKPKAGRLSPGIADELQSLTACLREAEASQVEGAAALLLAARRVWLLGRRSSGALAQAAWTVLADARPEVFLLAAAGSSGVDLLVEASAEDALIVFATNRHASETVRLASLARKRGVRLVVITDDAQSPAAEGAEFTFLAQGSPAMPLPCALASLALVQLILAALLRLGGAAVARRLGAVDRLLLESGEVLPARSIK